MTETWTVGGVMSGYCDSGSEITAIAPASVITIDSTDAKIGRSMKKREIIGPPYGVWRGRRRRGRLLGVASGLSGGGPAARRAFRPALGGAASFFWPASGVLLAAEGDATRCAASDLWDRHRNRVRLHLHARAHLLQTGDRHPIVAAGDRRR